MVAELVRDDRSGREVDADGAGFAEALDRGAEAVDGDDFESLFHGGLIGTVCVRDPEGFRPPPGPHQAVEGTQQAPHLEQQDPPLRTWWRPLLVAGHSPFISHKVAAVRATTFTVVAAVVVVVVVVVLMVV